MLSCVSITIFSQNLQDYVGIYEMNDECVLVSYEDYENVPIELYPLVYPVSTKYWEVRKINGQEKLGLRILKTADILLLDMINNTEFTFSAYLSFPIFNPYFVEGNGSIENNKLKLNCVFTGGYLTVNEGEVQCIVEGEKTNIDITKEDIQYFLGQYDGEISCKCYYSDMIEFYNESIPGSITIKEGEDSDLLFVDNYSFNNNEWRAFIYNDNSFVFYKPFFTYEYPELPGWFKVKGKVENEFLFYSYSAGDHVGTCEYEFEGKRIGSSIVFQNYSDKKGFFYSNSKKQIIVDKELLFRPLVFKLIDISGKIIFQTTVDVINNAITINTIPNGIYIYQLIQDGERVVNGKIIVSN